MFNFGQKKQNNCVCGDQNVDEQAKSDVLEHENSQEKKDINSEQMASCLNELASLKDTYLRLVSDFQNYKKRSDTDRIDRIEKAKADLLLGMLPLVDNFDRALDEAQRVNNSEIQQWIVGFELIRKIFYDFLKQNGVQELQASTEFDPSFHEAIAQLESGDHQSGQIITVFEKGFLYKGKVLRTAKVSVEK